MCRCGNGSTWSCKPRSLSEKREHLPIHVGWQKFAGILHVRLWQDHCGNQWRIINGAYWTHCAGALPITRRVCSTSTGEFTGMAYSHIHRQNTLFPTSFRISQFTFLIVSSFTSVPAEFLEMGPWESGKRTEGMLIPQRLIWLGIILDLICRFMSLKSIQDFTNGT